MANEPSYVELTARLAELRQLRDQSAGAEAELRKQLRDDHGLKSLDAARAEVKRLDRLAADKRKAAAAEYGQVESELAEKDHDTG